MAVPTYPTCVTVTSQPRHSDLLQGGYLASLEIDAFHKWLHRCQLVYANLLPNCTEGIDDFM